MIKCLKIILILFVCSLIAGTFIQPVKAQCAMCTTAVETNAQSGKTTTNGLNNGIMYLLAAPYIAVAAVGYIWYKKYRRKNVVIDMRDERLHLN
ncbi:MAG: hypothetical protein JWR67_3441 [Mucilaginibacter sp.]|jgi:hypothetical protein|nr:hypothetical protein [Mucilaginibacter sp.]MDB5112327.1 hypothetical protein [Mucilaginibacter sp.]